MTKTCGDGGARKPDPWAPRPMTEDELCRALADPLVDHALGRRTLAQLATYLVVSRGWAERFAGTKIGDDAAREVPALERQLAEAIALWPAAARELWLEQMAALDALQHGPHISENIK